MTEPFRSIQCCLAAARTAGTPVNDVNTYLSRRSLTLDSGRLALRYNISGCCHAHLRAGRMLNYDAGPEQYLGTDRTVLLPDCYSHWSVKWS